MLEGQPEYHYLPLQGFPKEKGKTLDKEAILYWLSTGFFLENDSFYKEVKWNGLDYSSNIWKYEPLERSLDEIVDEFAELLHSIVSKQTQGQRVMLALSGGLDSRTLASAIQNVGIKNTFCYSYQFESSFNETKYGRKIASEINADYEDFVIPRSYLWNKIESAAKINQCYAEFTHPRQFAVIEEIQAKGDLFLLGHLGDLVFDDMGISEEASVQEQLLSINRKVVKQSGLELAQELSSLWGLGKDFESRLSGRIEKMYGRINIRNVNARIRAFKSQYYVPRWTNTNMAFFTHFKPCVIPYYDDSMCEFVMKVPEHYLADRQIQIEYLKKYAPNLAQIEWQSKAPYNLYNFQKHKTIQHLPFRVRNKVARSMKKFVGGSTIVQRNWENQFIGEHNEQQLRKWLLNNADFNKLVPQEIVLKYLDLFKNQGAVKYSHSISMLLTLSVFCKQNNIAE
ncbi:asparagine synthetase B family protein [bacterium]|nr:asparagine synthetase B family protein [bacterium]